MRTINPHMMMTIIISPPYWYDIMLTNLGCNKCVYIDDVVSLHSWDQCFGVVIMLLYTVYMQDVWIVWPGLTLKPGCMLKQVKS